VAPAAAQDAILERLETDITVRVLLGATGRTVAAERVLVREEGAVMTTVAEAVEVDGEVTFADQMVYNFKPYIVSAWVDGVGYHVRRTGQTFLDGQAAEVHAFPQTDATDGLHISGLNVVARQRQDGFELEWICTLENRSRPQRTVRAEALPVRLQLPASLTAVVVEVDRGPDPVAAHLRPLADGWSGVAAALPPGEARVTVRGVVREDGPLELVVALNLPVERWSLLAWPAELQVRSFALERDRDHGYAEFARWRGEPLAAGQEVDVSLSAPQAVATAPAFADTADVPQAAPAAPPARRRVPWLTIVSAAVLLGIYALWRRRR